MQDRNGWFRGARDRRVFLATLALLVLAGCKHARTETDEAGQTQIDSGQATAAYNALTQGMTAIAFDGLTASHVGRQLAILAHTPDRADPPPPPRGMVKRMGDASIYTAELAEIGSNSLKIRAAYPTSGNSKIIEIPRSDIQAIRVGK
jgi:hypothetical protein